MLRFPFFRQSNDWSCGAATLRMALGAFGVQGTEAGFRKMLGTNAKTGTTRAALRRVAHAFGFVTSARHGRSLAELDRRLRAGEAVVVLYKEREADEAHYAVYLGGRGARVLLNDPWHGAKHALPKKEFLKRWRGTASRWKRWALVIGPGV